MRSNLLSLFVLFLVVMIPFRVISGTTCPVPLDPTTNNINTTGATLSWTATTGAIAYLVQYRPLTPAGAAWTNVTTQLTSVTLTTLTCGNTYEWHVATYCGTSANDTSPYSATIDFTTAPCATTCIAPSALTSGNITTTSATLAWTPVAGAVGYLVQYHSPGTAWINVTTQSSSATLTNLTCGTAYEWHVATICNTTAGGTSAYATALAFTTLPCATCVAPEGLNTTNITATGASLTWIAPAGGIAYIVQYHAVTIPASAWINVTATNPNTILTLTNLVCGTHYEWHVAAYCSNSTGTISPYSATADFTTAACTSTCIAPTGLTATNISTAGAALSWTAVAGAVGYLVQYHSPGAAWINVTTQSNSVTLTNLTCGIAYEWHVATVCGTSSTNISPYSTASTFTTTPCPPPCVAPSGLTTTNINQTSVILSWISPAGGVAYVIQYHAVTTPASPWINVTVTNPNTTLTLTTLVCGTHYEWHVAAYCSNNTGAISPYSATIDFTTAACTPTCIAPTGLTTTNISTTGATLSWTAVAGAVGYLVQYHSPGAAWVNVTTQSNSATLTNLTCGTVYEWHVATVCGTATGNISPYSAGNTFTTAPCPTTCNPPTGLITTNITLTGATLSWIAPAAALAYIVQYHPLTPAGSPWINVTTQTNSVTLTNLSCGSAYEWHVATLCANGTTVPGPYSTTLVFTTAPCTTNCVIPTGLVTTNISTTGALLSWTAAAGAVGYLVQYHSPGAAWVNVTTQSNSTTLTNLTCGTVYEWHVATVCGTATGNISPYSAGITFTTAPCTTNCTAPTDPTTTNISTTAATFSWISPAGTPGYIVQYRPVTATVSAWINLTATSTPITVTNLVCGTHYQWHVARYCGSAVTNISTYSPIADFITLPCTNPVCPVPTGLASVALSTSSTSRMLVWNPTGALAYNIRYRLLNAANWTTTTSTTSSILISGLQLAGHYEWQIQSVCSTNSGTSGISPWSQSAFFDTPLSRLAYPNPASGNTVLLPVITGNDARISVVISDRTGRTVRIIDRMIAAGAEVLSIDIADLESGIYFIQIKGDGKNEVQKLFITR